VTPTEIEVRLAPPYRVRVGPGALAGLAEAAAPFARCAVLTDATVESLHGAALGELRGAPRLALDPGEASKDLNGLGSVLDFLAEAGLERGSLLITFGGGVVSDLGGLAASLYMRGIAVVHCPTTLLAQVDAALGGKTAVNLRAGKNLAGTFHQPRAVLADTSLLATLSDDEFRSGLGEVVKSALLGAQDLFALLEREHARVRSRDAQVLEQVVAACVRLKAEVVAGDERDEGSRRALNLGHTFAHAIERVAGYGRVPHGVAVAVGLMLALRSAELLDRLEDTGLTARVESLLGRLGLPRSLGALRAASGCALAAEELIAAMQHDKKNRGGSPLFVLPRSLGRTALDVAVPPAILIAAVRCQTP
jgi:3-dehydroquinate synthase